MKKVVDHVNVILSAVIILIVTNKMVNAVAAIIIINLLMKQHVFHAIAIMKAQLVDHAIKSLDNVNAEKV